MQVVILAGGEGLRLRPITNDTPKPMVLIYGKPFLQYQLELLKLYGLRDVVLLVGYLGDRIEEYFGNGAKFGLRITYSYEKNLLGTAGALRNAEDKLANEFIFLNGDTYLSIDYNELIKYFHQCNKLGMLTVYSNHERTMPNNITIDNSNLVVDYNKKDSSGMTHIDAGAMVFKKEILNLIPKNMIYSLEGNVFSELIVMKQLATFPIEQKFYDIGSPEGLRALEAILR